MLLPDTILLALQTIYKEKRSKGTQPSGAGWCRRGPCWRDRVERVERVERAVWEESELWAPEWKLWMQTLEAEGERLSVPLQPRRRCHRCRSRTPPCRPRSPSSSLLVAGKRTCGSTSTTTNERRHPETLHRPSFCSNLSLSHTRVLSKTSCHTHTPTLAHSCGHVSASSAWSHHLFFRPPKRKPYRNL